MMLGFPSEMTNKMSLFLWISMFIFLGSALSQKQAFEAEVDDFVNAGIAARGIPGVSLAVVKNGKVVLAKGYGVKDVVTKSPVDADTLFGIASCSKAFTTNVLAKLLRNSTFGLSSKISEILGQDHAKFNNTLLTTYATLKDLMSHAMGIPRNNFIRLDTDLTRENLMTRLQYLPSTKEFRRSFVYSDLMYGLLTRITEVLGGPGKTWEDIVTSEFFQPLSMENSTFLTRVNFSSPNVATPYSVSKSKVISKVDSEFLRHYSNIGGSGAIMSTANDMAKYLQFQVNGGKNQKGEQVVQTSDLEATYIPVAALTSRSRLYPITRPTTPVTMSTDGYGLGWRTGYYRGYSMIQHSGTTYGYVSLVTILPQFSHAIYTAISGNDDGYNFRGALHCAILDLLLGEEPWLNSTTIATFPAPWVGTTRGKRSAGQPTDGQKIHLKTENDIFEEAGDLIKPKFSDSVLSLKHHQSKRAAFSALDIPLANFTGTFVHGGYGTAKIVLDSASDTLRFIYGIGRWELNHTGNGYVFDAKWQGPVPYYEIQLRFLVNSERIPTIAALNPENPTTAALNPKQPTTAALNPKYPTLAELNPKNPTAPAVNLKNPTLAAANPKHPTTAAVNPKHPTTAAVNSKYPTAVALSPENSTAAALNPKKKPTTATLNPKKNPITAGLKHEIPNTAALNPKNPNTATVNPRNPTTAALNPTLR